MDAETVNDKKEICRKAFLTFVYLYAADYSRRMRLGRAGYEKAAGRGVYGRGGAGYS